jgi:hypothetical protein
MGEGAGEGDSIVPPHLNPLPRRGEEAFWLAAFLLFDA